MDSLITMLSGISENKEDKSMKKLISVILTAVMIVTLAPSGAFACVSDSGDGAYVLSQNETWGESIGLNEFYGDVYIPEGTTLTTRDGAYIRGDVYVFGKLKNSGEAKLRGNVYVFGELENNSDLDIRGTLHCLKYITDYMEFPPDTSADRGIVNDNQSISYTSLDTNGNYLSMDITIPEVHEHNYIDESEQATRWDEGQLYVYCLTCGYKKTNRTIYPASQISISKKSFTWTGSRKTPSVTVKDSNGKALKKNTDYNVTYSNNKNVGRATVKVTLKGNYYGSKTMSFKIDPKGTSLSSVKAGTKSFTAKWKKQSKQTSGYQLRYSTSRTGSGSKSLVSGSSKTSKTIKNLKAKKKYYVRVRTYKKVNGVKYYSGWSKAKTVTTKKPASKPSTGGSSTRVYITETGARYHYNYNCRGLSNARRKIPTTLSRAKAQGYTLCGYEK